MDQVSKLVTGPPIWVESCMDSEEHREAHKRHPTTVLHSKPVEYDPTYHKGGKWRNGMGRYLTAEEAKKCNDNLDEIINYLLTKQKESNEVLCKSD